MTHRGRHRRRKRGRAVRAFLAGTALALTAAATMISASQATVTGPGALKPLTSSAETGKLRLQEELTPRPVLDRLAKSMGRPVGVPAVLKDADQTLLGAADCSDAERESLPVKPKATRAYCWGSSDSATPDWRPTSVTTSGDDEASGGHRVVLAGWTHSTRTGPAAARGLARIAVVNADDPARLAYDWVLLVVPTADGRDYRGLVSPVSGMVWHQGKLLVTAAYGDGEALYVYDLDRIHRTTADSPAIGRVPGGWSGRGYRYVMPAVGSYRFPDGRCSTSGSPCPGTLSLDSPDRGSAGSASSAPGSLLVSEWTPAGSDRHARLWRYAFSSDPARGGLLATDPTGRAEAAEAYETRAAGIRGVLARHRSGSEQTVLYVGHLTKKSPDGRGSLWRLDADGAKAARCGFEASHHCWTEGMGSLSYQYYRPYGSYQSYRPESGAVWALSGRMLFSMPLASIDSSLE